MSADPTDVEIEARLLAASGVRWRELWAAVDDLPTDREHGGGGRVQEIRTTVVDDLGQEELVLPYAVNSDALDRVVRALYGLGAIVAFNWPQWDGHRRYREGHGLESAPVADAVRLLTAIVRQERFSAGAIGAALRGGTFGAALWRLRLWHDDHLGRQPARG